MASPKSIGIKLYDDTFVPILTDGENKNKKVVLTTVRDDQKKMIIELYEGTSLKCINNEYLGKLVMPMGSQTIKGSPAIDVHLRLDDNGMLYAKAWDIDTGEENELKIQHSTSKRIMPETLTDQEIGDLDQGLKQEIEGYGDEDKGRGFKIALLILLLIILIGLLGAGSWFGVRALYPKMKEMFSKKDKPKKEVIVEKVEEEPAEEIKKEEPEEIKKEITGLKQTEGKKHYIRWGDNLWNICKKYYDDPWYYPGVAHANDIENPRLIYAGTYIIIPPKSSIKRWRIIE